MQTVNTAIAVPQELLENVVISLYTGVLEIFPTSVQPYLEIASSLKVELLFCPVPCSKCGL